MFYCHDQFKFVITIIIIIIMSLCCYAFVGFTKNNDVFVWVKSVCLC